MIENCAALTIAASDSGGGAGIQADLKTFTALGVYATCVITAVTAQNLTEVSAIQSIEAEVVRKQLKAVLEGFPIKAVKTGMLFSAETVEVVAETLSAYPAIPMVIDPVFAATSGRELIRDDAVSRLKEKLIPLAALVTPNVPEAEILSGKAIGSRNDMEEAARELFEKWKVPVLMKGGHLPAPDKTVDILFDGDGIEAFESPLIKGVNTHGSGCTLASAAAAGLAKGESLRKAISLAKSYMTNSLKKAFLLSPGLKVINHFTFFDD